MVVERMAQIMLGNAGRPVAMSAFPMPPAYRMPA
jgi:hypothetical protein